MSTLPQQPLLSAYISKYLTNIKQYKNIWHTLERRQDNLDPKVGKNFGFVHFLSFDFERENPHHKGSCIHSPCWENKLHLMRILTFLLTKM